MYQNPQPWLPQSAILPERIKPAIERLVAEWGRRWFVQARPTARAALQDGSPMDGRAVWRSAAGEVSVEFGDTEKTAIAGAMLGITIPAGPLQSGDASIIAALAGAATDDLILRLARLAGAGDVSAEISNDRIDFAGCGFWNIGLGPAKRGFKFALSTKALIGIVKQALPAAEPRPLVKSTHALAAQEVRISIALGDCALSVSDLKELAVGDVLVLDRNADSALEVHLNSRLSPLRACLEAKDDKATLVLL